MVEIEGYWIEIEPRGFVMGYSSSESYYNSVYFEIDELPKDFETHFSFYRLAEDLTLVFDDIRVKEEASKPVPETAEQKVERLLRENAEIQMALAEVYGMIMGDVL